ncbi:MAG TPA: CHAT domain-containing protein, partial [Steroidobacteraceae bacterium]
RRASPELRDQVLRSTMRAHGGELVVSGFKHHPLPDAVEMLGRARVYFERALPDRVADARGSTLKALAQTLLQVAQLDSKQVDKERVLALCAEALKLLPQGSVNYLTVVEIANAVDPQFVSPPLPDIASSKEDERAETPNGILMRARALERQDPTATFEMLTKAEKVFDANADENHRNERLMQMVRLIPRVHGGTSLAEFPQETSAAAKAIADVAQKESWAAERLAATYVDLAIRSGRDNSERLGLHLLQSATQLSPVIAAHYEPVAFLVAQLNMNQAVNERNAEAFTTALESYARALRIYIRLRLPTLVMDIAGRIADVAASPSEGMVDSVLLHVAPLAWELEHALGEPGTQVLREICDAVLVGLGKEANFDILTLILELAKGLRFDALMRSGASFDCRGDAEAAALLKQIESLQRDVGLLGDSQPSMLDDLLVVSAVSLERIAEGDKPLQRLHNFKRAFSERVNQHLRESVRRVALIDAQAIRAHLGPRTVLVDYYYARRQGNRSVMSLLVCTSDTVAVFRNVGDDPERYMVDTGTGELLVDPVALRTFMLRRSLRTDPAGADLHPETTERLNEDAGFLLGKRVWDHLLSLRKVGRDHLCIRPHGALRYYPLQLLGYGGQSLAQHWIITLLPSFECLFRSLEPRSTPGQALGLSYKGSDFPLPNASEEVNTLSNIFGTPPVLDENVTEGRVKDALKTARYVHICAHGAQTASAPLFHHFLVSPGADEDGQVCAYELLGQDLRGLQVLSLGVCDSALGRFDAGDNLTGLPASLLAGGVATVLATLWQVNDAPALRFFSVFYKALLANTPRLDAFRHAQLAVQSEFPQARDWAAFCYLGDWDRLTPVLDPGIKTYIELGVH